MNLTTLDNALWASGLLWDVVLLFVIAWRDRWRNFPYFSTWAIFRILDSVSLFVAYRADSRALYAWMYWLFAFVDIGLQIAVVFELSNQVFRSADPTSERTRRLVRWIGVAASVLALGLACGVHPSAPRSLDAWEVRGSLFASLLICELFTLVILVSQRFGFGWQTHAIGVGVGLTLWAIISLIVDGLYGYWGPAPHFSELEHVRILSFHAAQLFWIVSFWREEPERKPVTPEMREEILRITGKVSYDLAKVLGTRGKEFR